jgi:peptidoglycan-N-acetylglucosamine deacetylase
MTQRLCAISVDLDAIAHYRGLYGLAPRASGATAVHDVALGRMAAFAREHELPLTLFAVGRDLERRESAERLGELGRAGHAIENHSYGHRYDLGQLGPDDARHELVLAHERIAAVVGRAPQGFRAPGYGLSDTLLAELDRLGYRYDSSVFACPPYYLLKAVKMLGLRMRARPSVAVLGPPLGQLAPTGPYRPGRPWYRPGGCGLLELPIQVTPRLRLPVIGSTLLLAGRRLACRLARACATASLVNIELHGIDFLEPRDGIEDVAAVQADVRLPLAHKLGLFGAVVSELKAVGCRFVRLAEAAEALAPHIA